MQGAFELHAAEKAAQVTPKSTSFEFFCISGKKTYQQCTQIEVTDSIIIFLLQ